MRKNILFGVLLCTIATSLCQTAHATSPDATDTSFLSSPINNFFIAAGSTGLMLGLGSVAHYHYRQMRQSENMLALATLQKQQAQTDLEHETANQRMATHLRQRNRARNTMIYLLIPTILSGGSAAAFAGHGMWRMP